jgi:biofilm protein TabA
MAIYGKWQDCAEQVGAHPGFAAAFRFLGEVVAGTHEAAGILAALPEGEMSRYDIDGDRVYANLVHRRPRPREQQQLEAHRDYADVQFVLHGREILELTPLENLTETSAYEAESDAALFALRDESTKLLMDDGMCAVLFPNDAHAPLQARDANPQPSHRIVVKVRDPLKR